MNKQKTAIVVDSGADIPRELIERHDLKLLHLKVIYPEKEYNDEMDIEAADVYERFPKEIPTTAFPAIYEIKQMLEGLRDEGYENVLIISISSGLSGLFNAMRYISEDVQNLDTYVFDTKNISAGCGVYAVYAASLLEEGLEFAQIIQRLNDKIHDSKVFYYMDTLEYLRKGGRIGLVTSLVGSILNIKPIISCNEDGVYYTVAKPRGSNQSIKKLIAYAKQAASSNGEVWISIVHGGAEELAEQLKPILLKLIPNSRILIVKQAAPSLAVHTGPGLIGINVFNV